MNRILQRELNKYSVKYKELNSIKKKNILITGATGFIGSLILKQLSVANQLFNLEMTLIGQYRNENKFNEIFSSYDTLLENKIKDGEIKENSEIDIIIHTASPTSSNYFVTNPINTLKSIVEVTEEVLEYALNKEGTKIIYLSSMEVYGQTNDTSKFTEENLGYVSLNSVRSSYPVAKRYSELLCYAYYKEKGVDVRIARLSHVFGPGSNLYDDRILNYLIKECIKGNPVKLATHWKSIGNYCYSLDAIYALFLILEKGNAGETYNIVNEKYTKSIFESAKIISELFSDGIVEIPNIGDKSGKYPADTNLKLSAKKIHTIGWEPTTNFKEGLTNLYLYLEEELVMRSDFKK